MSGRNKNKVRTPATPPPSAGDDLEQEELEETPTEEGDDTEEVEEKPKPPTKEETRARIARYTAAQSTLAKAEADVEAIVKEIHDTAGPGRYRVNGEVMRLVARTIPRGPKSGTKVYKFVTEGSDEIIA